MARKKGLDLSPVEAHRMWSASMAGTQLGAFAYVYGLQNSGVAVMKNTENQHHVDKENNVRRKQVAKFLRSWADNLEGK